MTAVSLPGSRVPDHHGDPLGEQRLLATSVGLVDRSDRDLIVVDGPDRLGWLHSICSQHVSDLRDGDTTEALVLSPHGHVEQHWVLTDLGERVWIDTEPGTAGEVLGYLQKMRFLKRVELADVSADWAVWTLVGPRTVAALEAAGLPVPAAGHAVALPGGGYVRRRDWPGTDGADLLLPRGTRPPLDVPPAGVTAFEALRVEARRPRLGLETDHRTIPHEVGWIGPAVHLQKGCYRGQETVARVHNLGRPPRRMVLLHLSGESDVLPAPGTPVELDGRPVGFLGTAVHHYELGPVALAVVKRSVSDGLTVEGLPVAVDE